LNVAIVEPDLPLIDCSGFNKRGFVTVPTVSKKMVTGWLVFLNIRVNRVNYSAPPLLIMGLDRVTAANNGGPTAQSLLDFFIEKIETIRRSTGGSPPTTKLPPATSAFNGFQ
jgi:hypothetical protein